MSGASCEKMTRWRPQFTLRTLVLVPVAVAVALWCWAAWPQRTLSRLCDSMAQANFDRANEMVAPCAWTPASNSYVRFHLVSGPSDLPFNAPADEWRLVFQDAQAHLTLEPRSATDVLVGRGRLVLMGRQKIPLHSPAGQPVPMATPRFEFTAERGKISVTVSLVTEEN